MVQLAAYRKLCKLFPNCTLSRVMLSCWTCRKTSTLTCCFADIKYGLSQADFRDWNRDWWGNRKRELFIPRFLFSEEIERANVPTRLGLTLAPGKGYTQIVYSFAKRKGPEQSIKIYYCKWRNNTPCECMNLCTRGMQAGCKKRDKKNLRKPADVSVFSLCGKSKNA